MEIYLIRHGRQSSRRCNVNVDLCTEGQRQAQLAGERLLPYNIDILYSSDLIRAVETAEIINQTLRVKHLIRPELREISFGDMEGLTDEVIAEQFKDFKQEQMSLQTDLPYPGGECGEDVFSRIQPFFQELVESGKERAAIVTHGGVIRSFVTGMLGMSFEKKLLLARDLENCSITEMHYDNRYRRYYLERFNDHAHLEAYPELLRINWKK